jgi:hypothetical protein
MRAALEAIAGGGSDDRERTDSMDSTVGVFEQWAGAGEYRYAKGDIPHNAVRMKYTDGEHTGYASVLDMSNTLAPDTLLAIDSAGAALYEKTGVRLVVLAERRTERFTEGFRYYVESNILPFFNFSRLATSKWILLALQIDDCLSCAICGEGAKKIELNLNDRFYSHFVGGEYVRAVEEAIRQIERQTFTA